MERVEPELLLVKQPVAAQRTAYVVTALLRGQMNLSTGFTRAATWSKHEGREKENDDLI